MRDYLRASVATLATVLLLAIAQLASAEAATDSEGQSPASSIDNSDEGYSENDFSTLVTDERLSQPDADAQSGGITGMEVTDTEEENLQSGDFVEVKPNPAAPQSRSPRSVWVPTGDEAIITVNVAGDRLPDTSGGSTYRARMNNAQAAGLAGVTLYLGDRRQDAATGATVFTPFGVTDPANNYQPYSWAKCVSDAQGDCNFRVRLSTAVPPGHVSGASTTHIYAARRPSVGQWSSGPAAPTGWRMPSLPVYSSMNNNGSGSPSTSNTVHDSFPYMYALNLVMQPGKTYKSVDGSSYYLNNGTDKFFKFETDALSTNFTPPETLSDLNTNSGASGGRYMVVRNNPVLAPQNPTTCASNMAIVLDLSASMNDPIKGINYVPQAINAINRFVDKFATFQNNEDVRLSIFSFNTRSPALIGPNSTPAANSTALSPVRTPAERQAFKNLYSSWQAASNWRDSFTNWDDAFQKIINSGQKYDVVVFITDGAPTTLTTAPDTQWGQWSGTTNGVYKEGQVITGNIRSLEAGVFSANKLKEPDPVTKKGTRIIPFYFGNSMINDPNLFWTRAIKNSLANISGPTKDEDYFVGDNFATIGNQLEALAASCAGANDPAGKITVAKRVLNENFDASLAANQTKAIFDANSVPASGWNFEMKSASVPDGNLVFTNPPQNNIWTTAGADGKFSSAYTKTGRAELHIKEQLKEGYSLKTLPDATGTTQQNAYCFDTVTGARQTVGNTGNTGIWFQETANTIPRNVECVFYNQLGDPPPPPEPITAKITINKIVQDANGLNPQPGEGWELVAKHATTNGVTKTPDQNGQTTLASGAVDWTLTFPAGVNNVNVQIEETLKEGWNFVSGTCVVTHDGGTETEINLGGPTHSPPNSINTFSVKPEDDVNCTFVNKPDAPVTGSVTWSKVDDSTPGKALSGSEWKIIGPSPSTTGLPITDCVATDAADCTSHDKDRRAGYFEVTDLELGTYQLEETKAPAGYHKKTGTTEFVVSADAVDASLGGIVNTQITGPDLPFTGGLSRDAFFIGGLTISTLGLGSAGAIHLRNRRREVA